MAFTVCCLSQPIYESMTVLVIPYDNQDVTGIVNMSQPAGVMLYNIDELSDLMYSPFDVGLWASS
jgi:hypothetical protein